MTQQPHSRRAFLAASTAGFAGLAGCLSLGDSRDRDSSEDGTPLPDGYPPETAETPEERDVDTNAFETVEQMGTAVPLAPIDVVIYWYRRRAARFADARREQQYEQSHIEGAVLSPAPDGGENDPVDEWPKEDRIICYCGCPHTMSSMRAASLIQDGYEDVYVIDEGFWEWHDAGYPIAGADVDEQPELRVIRGMTDAALSGETTWAVHEPTDQHEATTIAADGTFELHLRFFDVTDASSIAVETPTVRIERSLSELTDKTVEL